ncbi:AEC family transporter [Ornithobacterium rhinotracheale]|uniref:AEC family transporter n=1 Tax=Ornithobacterium rhinotracheale TaxID=28251 RepID=UPI00129C93C2|nr:AEC family transporter [Ornithobacterium rhinotracheale]MRJ08608.1 AEC family transporter [Ornithobacterium rhinotracheale]UOH76946.1 AEC family transporter [Ornithobacterium rhinotracheale]
MDNFLLIIICIIGAMVMRRTNLLPQNAHLTVNRIIIYLSLPALVLCFIPKIHFSGEHFYALLMPWLAFLISLIFFLILAKIYQLPRALTGALILLSGLGNTSFLGIPFIQAMFGEHQIKNVLIIDQAGTFVVLSTLGLITCSQYSKEASSFKGIIHRFFTFPPFLAFLVSLGLNFSGISLPIFFAKSMESLGATVVPLALLSIGLQLRLERHSLHWRFVGLGLFCKLLLIPLIVYILYIQILGLNSELIKVTVLESAMPPMVTAGIVAASYGIKPRFCGFLVGYGIPASIITLSFWYWILMH